MDAEILRIINVNINRAHKALRVIEDYARFVLDDADGAGAAKRCRHELRTVSDTLGAEALLAARDIVSNVGRDVKTTAELQRGSTEEVVQAAFVRASEAALRSANTANSSHQSRPVRPKTSATGSTSSNSASCCVALRRRLRDTRLCVLVTEALCRRPWLQTVAAAIHGGAGCIQLREKQLEDGELLRRARELRKLTAEHDVLLAINDRPDIAKLARADIVHVGQEDLSVREIRRIAGASILVGKSTHTVAQFEAAVAEEPDYLAVGPMFQSETKSQEHIAGPQMLAAVRTRTELPLVAIGGITAASVAQVIAVGANSVAVCAAVIAAEDVEAAAHAIHQGATRRTAPGDDSTR